MKGAKFSPQNRSWNFISWSLQKPDCIYLIPCFIFIHISLSCFVFQSRRHSALCQADLGGMFCQGVLAVLWCTHHHSLLLTRHWGLTAHLGFFVCLGFFFTNRFSRILRPILKKGPVFLKKKRNEKKWKNWKVKWKFCSADLIREKGENFLLRDDSTNLQTYGLRERQPLKLPQACVSESQGSSWLLSTTNQSILSQHHKTIPWTTSEEGVHFFWPGYAAIIMCTRE